MANSKTSKGGRETLARRDGRFCRYCDRYIGENPTVDHWIPSSRGGLNLLENKVLACYPCNQIKGDMTGDEFLGIAFEIREQMRIAWQKKYDKTKNRKRTVKKKPKGTRKISQQLSIGWDPETGTWKTYYNNESAPGHRH